MLVASVSIRSIIGFGDRYEKHTTVWKIVLNHEVKAIMVAEQVQLTGKMA